MSAYALRAIVLIRLSARRGEWVPLPELVAHVQMATDRVRNVCDQLVQAGDAHQATHDGTSFFGIGVEGVPVAPFAPGATTTPA